VDDTCGIMPTLISTRWHRRFTMPCTAQLHQNQRHEWCTATACWGVCTHLIGTNPAAICSPASSAPATAAAFGTCCCCPFTDQEGSAAAVVLVAQMVRTPDGSLLGLQAGLLLLL
jgi:hypothetical protein